MHFLKLLPVMLMTTAAYAQPTVRYQASSGVSPSQQCWTYQGSAAPSPAGGVLDFGSSGSGELRYFSRTDLGGMDFAGSVTVSMRVQVLSGAYTGNPCGAGQRASVGFFLADVAGRHINVGLGSDRVYIGTENNPFDSATSPSAAFAWGGLMRDVRLEIRNLTVTLFIDGQNVVSVTRPGMPTGQTTPNLAAFGGDITGCASGHGRFERFDITAVPTGNGNITITGQASGAIKACATSPLVLSVSATSPWALGYQWRRNGVALVNGALSGQTTVEGADTATLTINNFTSALDGAFDCVLVNSCGSRTSATAQVTLPAPCGIADLGRAGGFPCPDGELDNNDFIVFINYFFGANVVADMGGAGGFSTPDGAFDNNDFIAFINHFFDGC